MTYEILVLVLLVALSAFFSGLEIALFSLGRAHLRTLVEKKVRGAATVARLKSNPERLLATILIGNNVANIGAASMATALAIRLFGNIGVGIATGVMTLLILVFGEITPKTLAYRWAEKFSLLFARPLELFGLLAFPVVWVIERFTRLLTRRANLGAGAKSSVGDKSLLLAVARIGLERGTIAEREHRVVEGALKLGHVRADRVMTPRSAMVAVEADKTVSEAAEELGGMPFSRYPVYRDGTDDIVGILHLRDLYEKLRRGGGETRVDAVASKPIFVPKTMLIGELLRLFQHARAHIAVVIGEYGETAGIVTLEDILEEMVGEIEDEADAVRQHVIKLGEGRYLVDASLPIEDLRRFTGVRLPSGHHTVNGLLLEAHQNIPRSGDSVEAGGHTFKIRRASPRRVILAEMVVAPGTKQKKT